MLITNCNGYQVIEAIAYNVEIYCIPRNPDQFYFAEALKLQYFKTQEIIVERPYTMEVFYSFKFIHLSFDITNVTIFNKNIYSVMYYIKEMFNRRYSKVVNKISNELREKWSKNTPKEIILEKVMEFVPIE
uniref:Glycosyltransferase n=1 Tax=Meloidogyne hapla TaxID=6305 RepID=A0A1I8BYU9_MELHA